MFTATQSLMILIAGPYRSGTGDDPALMEANLRTLESVALPLYRAGHIPLIGEWLALPLLRDRNGPVMRFMTKFFTPSRIGSSCVVMPYFGCRGLPRVQMKTCGLHTNAVCQSGKHSVRFPDALTSPMSNRDHLA
jgi:hypothetical protein